MNDHNDDVIGPGHPLYEMMSLAMQGNAVVGRRYDDGSVEITSARPVTYLTTSTSRETKPGFFERLGRRIDKWVDMKRQARQRREETT